MSSKKQRTASDIEVAIAKLLYTSKMMNYALCIALFQIIAFLGAAFISWSFGFGSTGFDFTWLILAVIGIWMFMSSLEEVDIYHSYLLLSFGGRTGLTLEEGKWCILGGIYSIARQDEIKLEEMFLAIDNIIATTKDGFKAVIRKLRLPYRIIEAEANEFTAADHDSFKELTTTAMSSGAGAIMSANEFSDSASVLRAGGNQFGETVTAIKDIAQIAKRYHIEIFTPENSPVELMNSTDEASVAALQQAKNNNKGKKETSDGFEKLVAEKLLKNPGMKRPEALKEIQILLGQITVTEERKTFAVDKETMTNAALALAEVRRILGK